MSKFRVIEKISSLVFFILVIRPNSAFAKYQKHLPQYLGSKIIEIHENIEPTDILNTIVSNDKVVEKFSNKIITNSSNTKLSLIFNNGYMEHKYGKFFLENLSEILLKVNEKEIDFNLLLKNKIKLNTPTILLNSFQLKKDNINNIVYSTTKLNLLKKSLPLNKILLIKGGATILVSFSIYKVLAILIRSSFYKEIFTKMKLNFQKINKKKDLRLVFFILSLTFIFISYKLNEKRFKFLISNIFSLLNSPSEVEKFIEKSVKNLAFDNMQYNHDRTIRKAQLKRLLLFYKKNFEK